MILAGVLLKMGTYGLLRFNLGLFPGMARKFAPVMITLAVLVITLAIAAPAMSGFVRSSQLSGTQTELIGALMLARSEATKRGSQVGVVAATPASGAEFTNGWTIWVDANSLKIVKTLGKFVQKGNQEFPVIEMIRATVDQQFLFPAFGSGDDKLVFPTGSEHLRIKIAYTDYVKLR